MSNDEKYAIIIERGENNYSAYVPDLSGCVATGVTIDELKEHMRGAIEMHLEGMREDGEPVPVAIGVPIHRIICNKPHQR